MKKSYKNPLTCCDICWWKWFRTATKRENVVLIFVYYVSCLILDNYWYNKVIWKLRREFPASQFFCSKITTCTLWSQCNGLEKFLYIRNLISTDYSKNLELYCTYTIKKCLKYELNFFIFVSLIHFVVLGMRHIMFCRCVWKLEDFVYNVSAPYMFQLEYKKPDIENSRKISHASYWFNKFCNQISNTAIFNFTQTVVCSFPNFYPTLFLVLTSCYMLFSLTCY